MTKEELIEQLNQLDEVLAAGVNMCNNGFNLNKEIVDLLNSRKRLVELIEKEES